LLKLDCGWAEVEEVIRGIQSYQANHQAAKELNSGPAVKTEQTQTPLNQVWRNCDALADRTRGLAKTIW
jgi:hypothetical protein